MMRFIKSEILPCEILHHCLILDQKFSFSVAYNRHPIFWSFYLFAPACSEGAPRLSRKLATRFLNLLWIALAPSNWTYVKTGPKFLTKLSLENVQNLLSASVSWTCLWTFITWNSSISRRSSVLQYFRSCWDLKLLC